MCFEPDRSVSPVNQQGRSASFNTRSIALNVVLLRPPKNYYRKCTHDGFMQIEAVSTVFNYVEKTLIVIRIQSV